MRWKDWPTWVKGGIIGIIVSVFVAISNIFPLTNFIVAIRKIFSNLFLGANPPFSKIFIFTYLFSFIIVPLILFAIGALIGSIIEKIKSKR